MSDGKLLGDASQWLNDYLDAQEEIELVCIREGMTDKEWDDHVAFVAECLQHGIKPTHFVDALLEERKAYNELFMSLDEDSL